MCWVIVIFTEPLIPGAHDHCFKACTRGVNRRNARTMASIFVLFCFFSQADGWPAGSVRSTYSTGAGRSSPVSSEASSHKSAASRLASKFQNGNGSSNQSVSQKKKVTKRRKMSASFTFLLACGLQIDLALLGSTALASANNGGSARLHADYGSGGSVRSVEAAGGKGNSSSSNNNSAQIQPSNGVGAFYDVRF
jgi:hypothetical protein